jgi:hypothetical protein
MPVAAIAASTSIPSNMNVFFSIFRMHEYYHIFAALKRLGFNGFFSRIMASGFWLMAFWLMAFWLMAFWLMAFWLMATSRLIFLFRYCRIYM